MNLFASTKLSIYLLRGMLEMSYDFGMTLKGMPPSIALNEKEKAVISRRLRLLSGIYLL